jgi:hypothetical protein
MPGRRRPLGISVLAVLAALGCVVGAAVLLAPIGGFVVIRGGGGAAIVAWLLIAVSGVLACGLWTLRWWAWPLAVVAWVNGGAQAVVALASGTIDTGLVVAPIALVYLILPDTRSAFGSRVRSPSRPFVLATAVLVVLPVATAIAGEVAAGWAPTVPTDAGTTVAARVDLADTVPSPPPGDATSEDAAVVASSCLDRERRPAGWLDLCWSVVRQVDGDPDGDYYRFEATGTFGAEATAAGDGSGEREGSGIRWLVLRSHLMTPVLDGVFSAAPDGATDGCQPDATTQPAGFGSGVAELPCDGRTVGVADLQTHTLTWTCRDCLLGPDLQERRIAMAEDIKVAEGALPAWQLYADFGN